MHLKPAARGAHSASESGRGGTEMTPQSVPLSTPPFIIHGCVARLRCMSFHPRECARHRPLQCFSPTQTNNLRLHLGRRDRTRAVSVQLASPQQCDGTECTPVRIAQDPGVSSCTRDGCSLQMVNIRAYSTAQPLSRGAVSKKSHKIFRQGR